MHKIPVTVVTGFLGSGKTTLIRNLLQNNQSKRIAVLVNEFGEVGIDGEILRSCQVCDEEEGNTNIVELANGCLCCTVQEEFLPTMQELLKRRDQIDFILIETSGLALPKPLIQAFRWPEIKNGATVDGVITIVDSHALAQGQLVGDLAALEEQRQQDDSLDHETPIEELFEDQLACADLVLLTKNDLLDEAQQVQVDRWLQQEVPDGINIIPCKNGQISPDILLGFNAGVEDDLDNRPSHHDHEEDHDHDDQINSVYLELHDPITQEALINKLTAIAKHQGIYRIKGFANIPHKPMRLVIQGVGSRFDSFFDRLWQPEEQRKTSLVFIGNALNEKEIKAALIA